MHPTAEDFTHPEDRAALERLEKVPLFPTCAKAFMKAIPERYLHGLNMAQKIRLSSKQLPNLYGHLPPICKTLDIEEPEFYLELDPQPNAYTYGDKQVFITLTSGLVESLSEEELRTVVAHECGHIACHHVLYRTMTVLLIQLGSRIFGPLSALSLPIQLALLHWFRRSELSADRAAATVMGGSKPVVEALIRLAGGPQSVTGEVNFELYMKQAEAYDKLMESKWDQFLQGLAVLSSTHPFLSVRAREITKWCNTPQYIELAKRIAVKPKRKTKTTRSKSKAKAKKKRKAKK